ncbi:MAG: hypothetical protein ACKVI8_06215 [Paraglaciecola sp.]
MRQQALQAAATALQTDTNWDKQMKILKLNEKEISELRVDTKIQFVTKAQLKTSPKIKGIFKWGVQAWALTINNKKVPVKPNKNSIFCVRFDELKHN